MPTKNIVLAFDAYGTLLSTESIAKQLATHFGADKARIIAATWRKYQLEYTWRLGCMNQYEPFSALTRRSLRHALAESNVTLSGAETDSLMESYDSLSTFPDVKPALDALASAQGITCVVFSNGTLPMVTNSVHKSPDLAPHASLFADIVVVEEVKKFKPCPEVYLYLAERVGKKKDEMADIWLVSGNPFDVVGARALGMNVAWVDRQGNGWQDSLIEGTAGKPTVVVRGLEEVLDKVHAHISKD